MTYVVCDGKFMIADRRRTNALPIPTKEEQKAGAIKKLEVFRDDITKIVIPSKLINYHAVDKKYPPHDPGLDIAAFAVAGTHTNENSHPGNVLSMLGDFHSYLTLLNANTFCNTKFAIIAITVSGQVIKLNREIMGSSIGWQLTSIGKNSSRSKFVVQSGSGSCSENVVNLFNQGQISLLDMFLYGAHYDRHCSTDYSVYSLDDKHLYTHIRASEVDVKASVDKINDLLSFKGLKTHYYNG